MIRMKFLLGALLALGLVVTGCGDDAMGGGGAGGTGGGSAGTGGTGGGSDTPGEDAQLLYEGEPLILDTVNSCLVGSDGMESIFSASVQSEEGAPNQVTFTLGLIAEPQPGTGLFDTLTMQGSEMDLDLPPFGQLDLVDFDPGIVQQLMGGDCTVDVTYRETMPLGPDDSVDIYDVDFECSVVAFNWLNIGVEPPMVTGSGSLTDLSGTFSCFMARFE